MQIKERLQDRVFSLAASILILCVVMTFIFPTPVSDDRKLFSTFVKSFYRYHRSGRYDDPDDLWHV